MLNQLGRRNLSKEDRDEMIPADPTAVEAVR